MGRPDAGPHPRARARAGRRDVPDPHRGREPRRTGTAGWSATAARSRASARAILADVAQAQARLERMARRWTASTRPGRRRRPPQWDAQTFDTWIRRNTATRGRRDAAGDRGRGRVGRRARGPLAPARPLLHVGGGIVRRAHRHRGRRPAGPVRRRVAARPAARWPSGSPGRSCWRLRCGAIDHDDDGVTVHADGHVVGRARSIAALPPTLTAAHRLAPGAAGPARSARAADAAGHRRRSAWRSTTGRSGASEGLSGQALSVAGPTRILFDNSPPDGSRGRPARLPRGPDGARAGRVGAGGAAARPCSTASPGCSARRPPSRSSTSSSAGPRRNGPAAATAATCRRGRGPHTGAALTRPIGRIHWAGAETASVWAGYMDGAVRSGERAAGAVLEQLA